MKDHRKPSDQLYVREKSISALAQVDSVVLDIDGVILDVSGSFRVAISRTVQFFFQHILGIHQSPAVLVSPEETQFFKLAGGFNNDWELTNAAVLFYLVIAKVMKIDRLDVLKKQGDLEGFCKRIKKAGGGIDIAEKIALEEALPELKGEILREWRTDLIKQIFQEYYAGTGHCRDLYGLDPEYIHDQGLLEQEKVILDQRRLTGFYPKLGVLTGRTKEETELALQRADLTELITPDHVLFDDGRHRKPDPELLKRLGADIGIKIGLYIGDTLDDLQTVINSRHAFSFPRYLSGIVASRAEEIKLYAEAGADIISLNVNEMLDTLMNLRQNDKDIESN